MANVSYIFNPGHRFVKKTRRKEKEPAWACVTHMNSHATCIVLDFLACSFVRFLCCCCWKKERRREGERSNRQIKVVVGGSRDARGYVRERIQKTVSRFSELRHFVFGKRLTASTQDKTCLPCVSVVVLLLPSVRPTWFFILSFLVGHFSDFHFYLLPNVPYPLMSTVLSIRGTTN